jgi:hypothetical protein
MLSSKPKKQNPIEIETYVCPTIFTSDTQQTIETHPYTTMLAPGSLYTFEIKSRDVINNMCKALLDKFPYDSIVKKVIAHLKLLDKSKVSVYSDFIVILKSLGNTTLHFKTSRAENKMIEYTIESFHSTPPPNLIKSNWLRFWFF